MNPFRLEMRLLTPIIFGDHSPSLDGVIYEFLVEHLGCDDLARNELSNYLQYTDGVAHASRLFFGTLPDSALIAAPVSLINKLPSRVLDTCLKPWGRTKGKPYPNVPMEEGETRVRMQTFNAYWAPYLLFFGVGDIGKISSLFNFYLSSIGSRARQGYGAVTDIQVITQDTDESWFHEGRLARFLPSCVAKNLAAVGTSTQERLLPPFWRKDNRVSGISPERIQTIFI